MCTGLLESGSDQMKVITLKQPWAYLVAEGYKLIEFRCRSSSFRGKCFLHASKKIDKDAFRWLVDKVPEIYLKCLVNGRLDRRMFATGVIIGKMNVVDCMTTEKARKIYVEDLHMDKKGREIWLKVAGDSLGNRAFIIEDPIHFSSNDYIPCKGKIFPLFFDPEIVIK